MEVVIVTIGFLKPRVLLFTIYNSFLPFQYLDRTKYSRVAFCSPYFVAIGALQGVSSYLPT